MLQGNINNVCLLFINQPICGHASLKEIFSVIVKIDSRCPCCYPQLVESKDISLTTTFYGSLKKVCENSILKNSKLTACFHFLKKVAFFVVKTNHAKSVLQVTNRPTFSNLGCCYVLDCKDKYPVACEAWAQQGECQANPGWMKTFCQRSCKVCTEGGYV